MPETAAELMARLAKNKKYQVEKNSRDKAIKELEKVCADDEKNLVEELNAAGFPVNSVWDFVNSSNYYFDAIPILKKHLSIGHHPRILAGLARSLAIPELAKDNELWETLTQLYDETSSNSEINVPSDRGAQEAIAVALECLASDFRASSLEKLIERNPNGDGINWLQDKLQQIGNL